MTDAHLTVLDVGHGSAAVITGPLATVLIDAGPGPWVLSYLKNQDLAHIDAIAITHADEDHLKGLVGLLDSEAITLGMVRVNSDAAQGSALWNAVTFSLDQYSRADQLDFQISLAHGDSLPDVARDVQVEVLAPSRYLAARGPGSDDGQGRTLSTNSMSAVVRVSVCGRPQVLLAADIDTVGLDNLIGDQDLRCPILVFPHHGGNVRQGASRKDNIEFTRKLCAAVQPSTVMFSLGRGSNRTPRREIIKAIREYGANVRIACTQLSEACAEELPPPEAFGHLADLPARGAENHTCCAGTLRIPLTGDVEPAYDAYESFKARFATTALCQIVSPRS